MKTQVNNNRITFYALATIFSIVMVFAFLNSAKAGNTDFTNEHSLEIENWMASETFWDMNEAAYELDAMPIENWMADETFWAMDKNEINEAPLKLKDWMTDESLWKMDQEEVEEASLEIKNWMVADEFWKM